MYIPSWKVVEQFEQRMATYCNSPYAIAVDTCTSAIFLCLKRRQAQWVYLPKHTYLGVACAAVHSGASLIFADIKWKGTYCIGHTIIDSACRLYRGMYVPGTLTCLSFQYKKHLKIGRGGMILTDNASHANWFRKARFCGRCEVNGIPEFIGWHCYMEPERAARGLVLLDSLPDTNEDLVFEYPDLSQYSIFEEINNDYLVH